MQDCSRNKIKSNRRNKPRKIIQPYLEHSSTVVANHYSTYRQRNHSPMLSNRRASNSCKINNRINNNHRTKLDNNNNSNLRCPLVTIKTTRAIGGITMTQINRKLPLSFRLIQPKMETSPHQKYKQKCFLLYRRLEVAKLPLR